MSRVYFQKVHASALVSKALSVPRWETNPEAVSFISARIKCTDETVGWPLQYGHLAEAFQMAYADSDTLREQIDTVRRLSQAPEDKERLEKDAAGGGSWVGMICAQEVHNCRSVTEDSVTTAPTPSSTDSTQSLMTEMMHGEIAQLVELCGNQIEPEIIADCVRVPDTGIFTHKFVADLNDTKLGSWRLYKLATLVQNRVFYGIRLSARTDDAAAYAKLEEAFLAMARSFRTEAALDEATGVGLARRRAAVGAHPAVRLCRSGAAVREASGEVLGPLPEWDVARSSHSSAASNRYLAHTTRGAFGSHGSFTQFELEDLRWGGTWEVRLPCNWYLWLYKRGDLPGYEPVPPLPEPASPENRAQYELYRALMHELQAQDWTKLATIGAPVVAAADELPREYASILLGASSLGSLILRCDAAIRIEAHGPFCVYIYKPQQAAAPSSSSNNASSTQPTGPALEPQQEIAIAKVFSHPTNPMLQLLVQFGTAPRSVADAIWFNILCNVCPARQLCGSCLVPTTGQASEMRIRRLAAGESDFFKPAVVPRCGSPGFLVLPRPRVSFLCPSVGALDVAHQAVTHVTDGIVGDGDATIQPIAPRTDPATGQPDLSPPAIMVGGADPQTAEDHMQPTTLVDGDNSWKARLEKDIGTLDMALFCIEHEPIVVEYNGRKWLRTSIVQTTQLPDNLQQLLQKQRMEAGEEENATATTTTTTTAAAATTTDGASEAAADGEGEQQQQQGANVGDENKKFFTADGREITHREFTFYTVNEKSGWSVIIKFNGNPSQFASDVEHWIEPVMQSLTIFDSEVELFERHGVELDEIHRQITGAVGADARARKQREAASAAGAESNGEQKKPRHSDPAQHVDDADVVDAGAGSKSAAKKSSKSSKSAADDDEDEAEDSGALEAKSGGDLPSSSPSWKSYFSPSSSVRFFPVTVGEKLAVADTARSLWFMPRNVVSDPADPNAEPPLFDAAPVRFESVHFPGGDAAMTQMQLLVTARVDARKALEEAAAGVAGADGKQDLDDAIGPLKASASLLSSMIAFLAAHNALTAFIERGPGQQCRASCQPRSAFGYSGAEDAAADDDLAGACLRRLLADVVQLELQRSVGQIAGSVFAHVVTPLLAHFDLALQQEEQQGEEGSGGDVTKKEWQQQVQNALLLDPACAAAYSAAAIFVQRTGESVVVPTEASSVLACFWWPTGNATEQVRKEGCALSPCELLSVAAGLDRSNPMHLYRLGVALPAGKEAFIASSPSGFSRADTSMPPERQLQWVRRYCATSMFDSRAFAECVRYDPSWQFALYNLGSAMQRDEFVIIAAEQTTEVGAFYALITTFAPGDGAAGDAWYSLGACMPPRPAEFAAFLPLPGEEAAADQRLQSVSVTREFCCLQALRCAGRGLSRENACKVFFNVALAVIEQPQQSVEATILVRVGNAAATDMTATDLAVKSLEVVSTFVNGWRLLLHLLKDKDRARRGANNDTTTNNNASGGNKEEKEEDLFEPLTVVVRNQTMTISDIEGMLDAAGQ